MTDKQRMKRIERASMRVLFQVPFFGPGLCKVPVELVPGVKTACTNGQVIKFDPAFLDKLKDQEIVTVLCHEVCHCLLGHLWRIPSDKNWKKWNVATDHAVNLMLKEFSESVKGNNLADPFPFPEPANQFYADPVYKGLAEEVIYSRLPIGAGGGGGSGGGKGSPGAGGQPGSMPSFGDIEEPAIPGNSTPKEQENDWTATLLQSARVAQSQGKLPAGLQRFVDNVVRPEIDWRELLASWLREQCADDWDFMQPAIEFADCEFLMPSLKSERMAPVVFATDTSGSIDDQLLAKFRGSKQSCLDELQPKYLVDIYCDAAITKVQEYTPGSVIGKDAPGGGGTDFRPVFKHALKMQDRPKCVVYLTDLYGTFPESDPGIPTMWVVFGNNDGKAPFGETIRVN